MPHIDPKRLLNSLSEMAKIGGTQKGGVCRLAATAEDKTARDLFASWAKTENCKISIDQIGNIFARRPGKNNNLAPVVLGSHLDSQPTGGKFDGTYGVLAALEVIRCLNDSGIETDRPVEAVSWTNEEGSRFPPAMMGSGVRWTAVIRYPGVSIARMIPRVRAASCVYLILAKLESGACRI